MGRPPASPANIYADSKSWADYSALKCHTTRHVCVSRDFNSGLSSNYMENISWLVARRLFTDALHCVLHIIFYGYLVHQSRGTAAWPVKLLPQLPWIVFYGEFGNSFLITILRCQCSVKDILLPQVNFVRKNQVKVPFERHHSFLGHWCIKQIIKYNTIFLNYYLQFYIPCFFPRKKCFC